MKRLLLDFDKIKTNRDYDTPLRHLVCAQLDVSNVCNAQCRDCVAPKVVPPKVTLEKAAEFFDSCAALGIRTFFFSCLKEASLSPILVPLIRHLSESHRRLLMIYDTNGIVFPEGFEEAVSELGNGNRLITSISIWGGSAESWRYWHGVDRFADMERTVGRYLSCTRRGAFVPAFSTRFISQEQYDETREFVRKKVASYNLGFNETVRQGFDGKRSAVDEGTVVMIRRINIDSTGSHDKDAQGNIVSLPAVPFGNCPVMFVNVAAPDGLIRPCISTISPVLGDIFAQPVTPEYLRSIYTGSQARSIMEQNKKGQSDFCKGCLARVNCR
ncbi:MAG: hypothetical protein K2H09_02855 [Treponemataceae bacterium]|nr:hypothetical protein [Treponemataceae bacterium]